jgi:dTDP-4-amino-4,6-dideoxygalactose transaminase
MKLPFLNPNITSADRKAVDAVLKSGWLATGPELKTFEKNLAEYLGIEFAIANSSGTAALHTALLAAGVGEGDEVITTPLTFWATSNAILFVGAKPVFVDVDASTGLISVEAVKMAITKKTKAIIPVHLYGQLADMKKLAQIARKYKLKIIEDAPHALEASREGIRPGQLSFASCFSFHAAKNITAGEGGAVGVHTAKIADEIRLYNDSGSDRSGKIRQMTRLGYKYSMTNMQGAMLLGQLARIEDEWKKRRKIYQEYVKGLSDVPGIRLIEEVSDSKHAYHMFTIIVDIKRRDAIRTILRDSGVPADIHYNPVHLEPYYRKTFGYKQGMYPEAERIGLGTITLPMYTKLKKQHIQYIIQNVINAIKK